jgi:hypothetical protein
MRQVTTNALALPQDKLDLRLRDARRQRRTGLSVGHNIAVPVHLRTGAGVLPKGVGDESYAMAA